DNPIVVENRSAGTTTWMHGPLNADDTNLQIKGYWSSTSVRPGDSITLFVTVTPAQTFTLDLFRMGWYGGAGGRQRLHLGPLDGITQRACVPDPQTGLIECGWTPTYALTIPADWTSGMYLGLLTNAAGYQNHVLFVVRDDRPAPYLYQMNIATDQAYNNFPNDGLTGKSLYSFNSFGPLTMSGETRAVKVSFDRPYADFGFKQIDTLEFIRWIEREGYDVTYSTSIDTHERGSALLQHRAFLSVGHDEYWSKEMRDAVEAARDAGVNLAFFAADAAAWQIRFEPSTAGVPDRVIAEYRSAALDPVQGPATTVRFRDPPLDRPEQTLVGVISEGMISGGTPLADYVVTNSSHWLYTGTGFHDGDTVPGIVGYEMDRFLTGYPAPAGTMRTLLSASPYTDFAGVSRVANSSIYRAPSGAWVFASGTIGWSRGLDGLWYQRADARIQRTARNLLDAFVNGPPVTSLQLAIDGPIRSTKPFPIVVVAIDAVGDVATRYDGTVHFTSSDTATGVSLPADATLANGRGGFAATLVTLGAQTITVSDSARGLATTAGLDVRPAPATHFVVTAPANATAGASFAFAVSAQSDTGSVDTDYAGVVHVTTSDPIAPSLPPDAMLSGGAGTFTVTLARAGAQTVTATDTANTTLTGQAPVAVRAAAASHLVLTTVATATAGATFTGTIAARDPFDNVDTAYAGTAHFTSTDTATGVVLPADAALANGAGTFSATLIRAGAQTITATDTAKPSITGGASLTVRAAPASRFAVTAPASTVAGTGFTLAVEARDPFGNVDTAYGGTLRFSSSDTAPQVVLPPYSPLVAGRGSFGATLVRAGSQTVTATDVASAGITGSATVAVAPAAAASLALDT
ncbi:MAG TPA: N,N-dimethylformamidase beta subunit family domain-containing protein, partial [Candidatus Limnocylindria bacterium]|nr:N,N-dimethylformamidase beta subunit family domain-containing protein [Candidatus Limnocylindria bacterium]